MTLKTTMMMLKRMTFFDASSTTLAPFFLFLTWVYTIHCFLHILLLALCFSVLVKQISSINIIPALKWHNSPCISQKFYFKTTCAWPLYGTNTFQPKFLLRFENQQEWCGTIRFLGSSCFYIRQCPPPFPMSFRFQKSGTSGHVPGLHAMWSLTYISMTTRRLVQTYHFTIVSSNLLEYHGSCSSFILAPHY